MEEQAHFVIDVGDGWWPSLQPGFFGPEGHAVAFMRRSDSGDRVYVVDVETGQPTRVVQPVPPEGYSGYVAQLRPVVQRRPLGDVHRLRVVASYYRPDVLSRVIEETWIVTWEGAGNEPLCEGRISPDGRYTAWMEGRPVSARHIFQVGPEEPVPSVVIADAGTCEPILRVRYAILLDHGWEGQWLAHSKGLLIRVEDGFAVLRLHTTPALDLLPAPPSAPPHSWGPLPPPSGSYGTGLLYDLAGIYHYGYRWVEFPVFDALSLGDGVSKWGVVRWGYSNSDVQFITTDYLGEADVAWDLQPPEVELLVPVLAVVSDGSPDALNLEWTGGPAAATGWQYRTARGEWLDMPEASAETRRYRLDGLREGASYSVQVRAVVGTVASEPSEEVRNETPTLDPNGIPWLGLWRIVEGGRAWRVGATVVDIPAGMRVFARAYPPGDPRSPYKLSYIFDAESDSTMSVATDFGAECSRFISPSAAGRNVGALFDQIIASARVTLDARPDLTTVTTGDRGLVSLRWFGAPDEVTHWEYRLRGPYPIDGPWPETPWGEWMEVAGSDADTRSHRVRGLPDGTSWSFQVRAVAGNTAGAPSRLVHGASAVVGPDGVPQLRGYPQRAEGGRTWRLADSPTVIDVPADLEVELSEPDADGGTTFHITNAADDYGVYVNAETATELGTSFGWFVAEPPCGFNSRPATVDWDELFEQLRASIRLQPLAR